MKIITKQQISRIRYLDPVILWVSESRKPSSASPQLALGPTRGRGGRHETGGGHEAGGKASARLVHNICVHVYTHSLIVYCTNIYKYIHMYTYMHMLCCYTVIHIYIYI